MSHIPVLLHETIEAIAPKQGGIYVDCTVNRAGHAQALAKSIGKKGTLYIFDLDAQALNDATRLLSKLQDGPTIIPILANFRTVRSVLAEKGIEKIDGLIADLGLSSQELDSSGRGFSFRYDEPLVMTFSSEIQEDTLTAQDVVNTWKEESLADILYGFADEKYSRRIAKAIVKKREEKEIETTYELVSIIGNAVPTAYRHGKTHFATKTFQALRMAVNDELGSITELIGDLPSILQKDARACIITFHSTEDRTVKNCIRNNEHLVLVNKKAIAPSEEELINNPRARSAQLRIATVI